MIELEYSPKLHIQALYRSISLVYYDSMSVLGKLTLFVSLKG